MTCDIAENCDGKLKLNNPPQGAYPSMRISESATSTVPVLRSLWPVCTWQHHQGKCHLQVSGSLTPQPYEYLVKANTRAVSTRGFNTGMWTCHARANRPSTLYSTGMQCQENKPLVNSTSKLVAICAGPAKCLPAFVLARRPCGGSRTPQTALISSLYACLPARSRER